MIKLSAKQREALAHFASEPLESWRAHFASGTLSSLRKAGLIEIVPKVVPRRYVVTFAGRAALAQDATWNATLAREGSVQ